MERSSISKNALEVSWGPRPNSTQTGWLSEIGEGAAILHASQSEPKDSRIYITANVSGGAPTRMVKLIANIVKIELEDSQSKMRLRFDNAEPSAEEGFVLLERALRRRLKEQEASRFESTESFHAHPASPVHPKAGLPGSASAHSQPAASPSMMANPHPLPIGLQQPPASSYSVGEEQQFSLSMPAEAPKAGSWFGFAQKKPAAPGTPQKPGPEKKPDAPTHKREDKERPASLLESLASLELSAPKLLLGFGGLLGLVAVGYFFTRGVGKLLHWLLG